MVWCTSYKAKDGPIGPKKWSSGPRKTTQTVEKLKIHFSTKTVFFHNSGWDLGGLGVSGGKGADHTKTLSRTLAGFGLTGHGGSRFPCFWNYWKLTSSPNTSKLVLGPPGWSSDLFWKPGHHLRKIKPINFPTNDPKQKIFSGNLANFPKSSFFDKMAGVFLHFFVFCWAPVGRAL